MMAVDLCLPSVGDLCLQPEEAVVEDDDGVGVGGASPDDTLNLESGEGAVDGQVGEGGGGGGLSPGLQQDSQGARASVQAV